MGLSALCKACNVDLLGSHYVPAFTEFVEAGKQMIASVANRLQNFDEKPSSTALGAKFVAVDRLAVAKQIVSMILVTSGRKVVEEHPALGEFVRAPQKRAIPSPYRLFLRLTPGPAAKVTGQSERMNIATGERSVVAEVVYPPFAYALSFDGTAA